MKKNKQRRPLMGTDNILDLQNNGYKSTVSAIAEIIDNSIQARANKVDVIIVNNTLKHSSNICEILILDNGDGMNEAEFDKALMMNAGARSGANRGLGRYGQGLPNSSVSQTKRVEVYTFKEDQLLYNHIDLDEIFESKDPFLPEIENLKEIKIPVLVKTNYTRPNTGTIVRWVNPNQVKPGTSRLLVENINKHIGRIFRYYINGFEEDGISYKTDINILVYDFNGIEYDLNSALTINNILPFDPMFLMENTSMNAEFKNYSHPTSELYDKVEKEFEITIINTKNEEELIKSKVEIIFSNVKAKEHYREGRRSPGETSFGKKYLRRNLIGTRGYENISILRANREIDTGDFGFLGDVTVSTLRWWSIEIKTDASLDTIIGVDNKKQQASNIRFLDSIDDDDSHEVLVWISEMIKNNISGLNKAIAPQYHTSTTPTLEGDGDEGDTGSGGNPTPPLGPTEPGSGSGEDTETPTDRDKQDLFEWIKARYEDLTDKEIWSKVNWAFSISDRYIFVYSDLGDTSLYGYTVYGGKVLIEINFNHSFYKKFMAQLESESEDSNRDKKIRSIRLLISSFVKAETSNKTDDKNVIRYLRKYKNSIAISLDEYIDDLFSN